MAIKLLIVDDSAFMRKIISDIVERIEGVEVVGIARNGLDALDSISKLKPDIVTLDVEMPVLNGIETLKRIKEDYNNIPVIMLSSHTGTDITIEALQIGAVDFIEKPTNLKENTGELKDELEIKIKSVVNIKNPNLISVNRKRESPSTSKKVTKAIKAVVIGASTGGPKALVEVISRLPKAIKVPIFIVQHMPKGFTTSFANRLDKESKITVVEARHGMTIQKGVVYLAPGDYHMVLDRNRITLNRDAKIHGVRPAVDYLFQSATKVYQDQLLAIILTGMGKDGTEGMESIKKLGGYTIAQSKETCVVYGMPGNAVSKGVVDKIMSLEEISQNLNRLIWVE